MTMRTKVLKRSVMPLSLCATSVALGQNAITPLLSPPDSASSPVALEPKEQHLNFMTLGFQLGFNVKTSFKNIGRFPAASNPGPANGFSNHTYDDGTNRVDSTGNQHFNGSGFTEGTWYWGYDAGATTPNNGGPADQISMHSLSSAGG